MFVRLAQRTEVTIDDSFESGAAKRRTTRAADPISRSKVGDRRDFRRHDLLKPED